MDHLFINALFLLLCQMQGSTAVTTVFVQTGNDVLLDVIRDVPGNFTILLWTFNGKDNFVKFLLGNEPTVLKTYTGRVEFSKEDYSVQLKNLQETDSGVYTTRVIADQDHIVAEYNVTVQDPVSLVELTVDSVSSSSDSCNLTVTCRTQDSHISSTFTCVNQTCSDDEETSKTTTSGAVLHVYFVNHSITCNHSNEVSWTTNKEQIQIQDFCSLHNELKGQRNHSVVIITVIIATILIIGAVFCYRQKRKKKIIITDNTVYAVAQVETKGQTLLSGSDRSSLSPNTTYSFVGHHTGPKGSTGSKDTALPESLYDKVETSLPESLYDKVERPARA